MPKLTHLTFPELHFPTRSAHHLRGYFGRLFQEHSPLLHNHLEGGGLRYAYPLVQYKVLGGLPVLVGVGEGAQLLIELFLRIRELDIDGQRYPLHHKDLRCEEVTAGYSESLHTYTFRTLWMALNQKNFAEYVQLPPARQEQRLAGLLRNQILAAFKGMGVWLEPEQRILAQVQLRQKETRFKDQRMIAFEGQFTTNAVLPRWIGIGKAVSRGFGTVERVGD
ncbi:MAG: hypothetical protein KDC75_10515 [Phaeodactylibacter sp.]|nr:hypothetical protein [Phaeodactylibacter sp.]